jgi:SAM-dependent methyltransferase
LTRKNTTYDQKFFEGIKEGSFRSAMKIIPMVKELIPLKSVVDVGCGSGSWLRAFQKNGVKSIFGVDGNQTPVLDIPADRFLRTDLNKPFDLKKKFDLAVSMEVAEHLSPESADPFVENLTRLAPAVLFSAAIPGQGGAGHVNEEWPSYWAEKFAKHGYVPFDCLRLRIWEDPAVEWWYSQNILLYVKKSYLKKNTKLSKLPVSNPPARLIHPESLTITNHLINAKRKLFKKYIF